MKTRVSLKYYLTGGLWKPIFGSNLPQASLNLISLIIFFLYTEQKYFEKVNKIFKFYLWNEYLQIFSWNLLLPATSSLLRYFHLYSSPYNYKFFLVGDNFMPEVYLKHPEFTYSACRPFSHTHTKNENTKN